MKMSISGPADLPSATSQDVKHILAISGSLRTESYNLKLLAAVQELASSNIVIELWSGLKQLPPFDEDDEDDPGPVVLEFRDAIAGADALLIATPQYNGSLPGQLKNALDWASRPDDGAVLGDKPVAVVGASPSPRGAARAQAEARLVLAAAGARVLEVELPLPEAHEQFDAMGRLTSAAYRRSLSILLEQLAASDHAPRSSQVM